VDEAVIVNEPQQLEISEVKPKYTDKEKDLLIKQQIIGLREGNIKPEFSYKEVIEEKPELEAFKKYFNRYLSGEVSDDNMKIWDNDWLACLKNKDRKKKADFIDQEGWQLRRNEIAVMHNRPLTDMGNAERLVDQFGTLIRFSHQMKEWFVWDYSEGRWKIDNTGYINRMAKDVIRRLYYEAPRSPSIDHNKKTLQWAHQCECKTHTIGMLDLAQHEKTVLIHPDDFDKNDMLFNLRNGTFNLKTYELEPHNKSNNISKLADYEYDPKAKCPLWEAHLARIFKTHPNRLELIRYLQQACGYTLTGKTSEQSFHALHGAGANGKSVFLDVILAVMGEYGTVINSKALTTERGDINNDIAALVGKRFVYASENPPGSHLDEQLIKSLTGGDVISARFLHKEFFTFRPKFKLWWAFNHAPQISDMTISIWRRIKMIPFIESLPIEEQDKYLADKIKKSELPGIFNWCVNGLREYNEKGLCEPEIVKQTVKQYKDDQDILAAFFDINYEITSKRENQISANDLHKSYQSWWLSMETTKPMSSTKFGRSLKERGLEKIRLSDGFYYVGIRQIKYIK